MNEEFVTITLQMTPDRAEAMAQFVKRLTWNEMRQCAVNDDETYIIREGISLLQQELAEKGFNPR